MKLVLHRAEGTSGSRLNKRNGYLYKGSVTPGHTGNGVYESSHSVAPVHEVPSGGSAPASGKYDDSFVEYKIVSGGSFPSAGDDVGHNGHGGGGGGSSGVVTSSSSVHGSSSKAGYSLGSGLRSIAQGSANQAYSAVASQHAAAKQAAFLAKNSLAQAASQAAATAQAALQGKQVLLQELELQAAEAQRALSRELSQLKAAKVATKLAQQTAQAAINHVSVLTAAVNNAKAVAEHAEQTSSEVSNQMATQSSMVGQAKSRLEQLEEQLKQASIDYEATKEAALKAASAAAEAQVNASKAAAHATLGLHESAQQQHQHYSDVGGGDSYEVQPVQHVSSGHGSFDRSGQSHKRK